MGADRKMAFKVGFLCKLAELGVQPSEFYKAADGVSPGSDLYGFVTGRTGKLFDKGIDFTLDKALPYALAAAIGIPLVAGTVSGAVTGKLTSPISESIDDVRKKELIDTYRRLASEVKSRSERQKGLF
jgi:hypothetical protein